MCHDQFAHSVSSSASAQYGGELLAPTSSVAVAEQVDEDIERLIAACWVRDATGSTVALGHLRADIVRLVRYTVVETREMLARFENLKLSEPIDFIKKVYTGILGI